MANTLHFDGKIEQCEIPILKIYQVEMLFIWKVLECNLGNFLLTMKSQTG